MRAARTMPRLRTRLTGGGCGVCTGPLFAGGDVNLATFGRRADQFGGWCVNRNQLIPLVFLVARRRNHRIGAPQHDGILTPARSEKSLAKKASPACFRAIAPEQYVPARNVNIPPAGGSSASPALPSSPL